MLVQMMLLQVEVCDILERGPVRKRRHCERSRWVQCFVVVQRRFLGWGVW